MALKDWKKKLDTKDMIIYHNINNDRGTLAVVKNRNRDVKYFPKKRWGIATNTQEGKDFQTKAEAMKYARAYMKKH